MIGFVLKLLVIDPLLKLSANVAESCEADHQFPLLPSLHVCTTLCQVDSGGQFELYCNNHRGELLFL